jgi:transcriptional regulator with XRE-family HTH domain
MGKKKQTIGDRVTLARESKNLSRIQLAIDAGVSQGTIQLIERGVTRNPSDDVVSKLARALGTTSESLKGVN